MKVELALLASALSPGLLRLPSRLISSQHLVELSIAMMFGIVDAADSAVAVLGAVSSTVVSESEGAVVWACERLYLSWQED